MDSSSVKGPEKPIETITPENLKQEKYGYSVSIDKIEFYKKETRVYLTAVNNGGVSLYVDADSSVVVQDGKQLNAQQESDGDLEKIPYEIVQGASSSGIILFPSMSTNDFELTINVYSNKSDEKLGKFTVTIGQEKSEAKKFFRM